MTLVLGYSFRSHMTTRDRKTDFSKVGGQCPSAELLPTFIDGEFPVTTLEGVALDFLWIFLQEPFASLSLDSVFLQALSTSSALGMPTKSSWHVFDSHAFG